MRGRFATVPTNGRPCVEQCLDALIPQVDVVLVVETMGAVLPRRANVARHVDRAAPNISRWWNHGLRWAQYRAEKAGLVEWDVAVINDDVILPEGWFDAVSAGMRSSGAAAACSGGRVHYPILHQAPGPVDLFTRLQGFAFMLAGEKGQRVDERLVWWAGDDDIDWTARKLGGTLMIPGFHVEHLYPNEQMTGEFQVQAAKDLEFFVQKWGMRAW